MISQPITHYHAIPRSRFQGAEPKLQAAPVKEGQVEVASAEDHFFPPRINTSKPYQPTTWLGRVEQLFSSTASLPSQQKLGQLLDHLGKQARLAEYLQVNTPDPVKTENMKHGDSRLMYGPDTVKMGNQQFTLQADYIASSDVGIKWIYSLLDNHKWTLTSVNGNHRLTFLHGRGGKVTYENRQDGISVTSKSISIRSQAKKLFKTLLKLRKKLEKGMGPKISDYEQKFQKLEKLPFGE